MRSSRIPALVRLTAAVAFAAIVLAGPGAAGAGAAADRQASQPAATTPTTTQTTTTQTDTSTTSGTEEQRGAEIPEVTTRPRLSASSAGGVSEPAPRAQAQPHPVLAATGSDGMALMALGLGFVCAGAGLRRLSV
jgi:hypothetical protein